MGIFHVSAGLLALDAAIYLALGLLALVTWALQSSRTPALLRPWVVRVLGWIERERDGQRPWRKIALGGLVVTPLAAMLWLLLFALESVGERFTANPREAVMAIEYVVVGLVALGIAIYLAIALLRPDKF